jgi:hypothetical protein
MKKNKDNFVDINREIDDLIDEKIDVDSSRDSKALFTSSDLEPVRDNIKFVDEVINKPVVSDRFDKKVFDYETVNINPYILQQAWPSSLYFIDKLIRLNTSASLEWKKRYLSKKRKVSMNMVWLIILLAGAFFAVFIVFAIVVPMFSGG